MIESKLLNMLRYPIDKTPLANADEALVRSVNDRIQQGELRDHADQKITDLLEHGLVSGQKRLYPVRGGIPILVAEESIDLG